MAGAAINVSSPRLAFPAAPSTYSVVFAIVPEVATGCHVNGVWPEVAADFLRQQEVEP